MYVYIHINDFPVVCYNKDGGRKNVYGFLMQFSGYQGIWCVFATSLFIIWQIVSTSSVGHLQAFVHIAKSELGVTGNIDAHSRATQRKMLHIKKKNLSLMFRHVPISTRSPSGGIYNFQVVHPRCVCSTMSVENILRYSIHNKTLLDVETQQ